MVVQLDLLGTPNIGIYVLSSDTHCFIPPDIPDNKQKIIEKELSVPVSH
jgi:translation initiation factor 6 (eIF-6)